MRTDGKAIAVLPAVSTLAAARQQSKLERKQGYQEEETCPVCRLPGMWTDSAQQIVKY
jgi:hypothetical protein